VAVFVSGFLFTRFAAIAMVSREASRRGMPHGEKLVREFYNKQNGVQFMLVMKNHGTPPKEAIYE
jgi:hypothetical protein